MELDIKKNYPIAVVVLIIAFLIVSVALALVIHYATGLKNEYTAREKNRNTYYSINYNIEAELYAVTPDGTEVLEDRNGTLWEVPNLHINRHDCLVLEIKNGELNKVMVIQWVKEGTW